MVARARAARSAFDEELGRRVVRTLAKRKLHLFDAENTYGLEDLVSEGIMAARRAWPTYDSAKASPSTFIYLCASRRIIALYRRSAVRLRHEKPTTHEHLQELVTAAPARDAPEPEDLADWLGQTYRAVKGIYLAGKIPLRHPTGNHRYPDRAQRAALLLLMHRRSCSSRGLAMLLRQHPELLAAVRMTRCPDASTLRRLKKSGARIGIRRGAAAVAAAAGE